jgi:predicted methyltransferase
MASLLKAVAFAQHLQKNIVKNGNIVVDATAGKGYDTTFLARLVGEQGMVYAFDIQEQALVWTKGRLLAAGLENRVQLIHKGHERMSEYLDKPIQAVMFNLGYLPGSVHDVITRPETTVPAIQAASELLAVGGLITVVIYPGHPGGEAERDLVEDYVGTLPQQRFVAMHYQIFNQINNPPLLIAIEKIA